MEIKKNDEEDLLKSSLGIVAFEEMRGKWMKRCKETFGLKMMHMKINIENAEVAWGQAWRTWNWLKCEPQISSLIKAS